MTVNVLVFDSRTLDAADVDGFDALITDPPYSPRVHAKATSNGSGGSGPVARDLGFEALDADLRGALAVCAANVQRWSAVFSDIEGAHAIREAAVAAGAEYIRTIPWVRWSQPQLTGDRPPSGCELVTVAHRAGPRGRPIAKRWSGHGGLVAFDHRSLRGADKHPTEKPLDLMLSLVAYFTEFGESVIDPCAGSGTTGLACRILGRSALCLEINPTSARIAETRVAAPLSGRDYDRVARWIEEHEPIVSRPVEDSGRERQRRLAEDVERAREEIGL